MSIRSVIVSQFQNVADEQNRKLAPLSDDLVLLESGLDSLCFAIIVARLDDVLGSDPFSASTASADGLEFPITFGDFVRAYENAHPR